MKIYIFLNKKGGCGPAIYIQEYLNHFGFKTDHNPIKTKSYNYQTQEKEIDVSCCEYLIKNMNRNDMLILIDDVFESGRSFEAVLNHLKKEMRANFPKSVIIATLFYKPDKNKTNLIPNYYHSKVDGNKWLVFCHEIEGLTFQELCDYKDSSFKDCINLTMSELQE